MEDFTGQLAKEGYYHNLNIDVPVCQHDDCNASAMQCIIPGGIDCETGKEYPETYEYYCPSHAGDEGYCMGCGTFIAGWRDFSSFCEHCEDQIKSDTSDFDDDDISDGYDFFDDPYYP